MLYNDCSLLNFIQISDFESYIFNSGGISEKDADRNEVHWAARRSGGPWAKVAARLGECPPDIAAVAVRADPLLRFEVPLAISSARQDEIHRMRRRK